MGVRRCGAPVGSGTICGVATPAVDIVASAHPGRHLRRIFRFASTAELIHSRPTRMRRVIVSSLSKISSYRADSTAVTSSLMPPSMCTT